MPLFKKSRLFQNVRIMPMCGKRAIHFLDNPIWCGYTLEFDSMSTFMPRKSNFLKFIWPARFPERSINEPKTVFVRSSFVVNRQTESVNVINNSLEIKFTKMTCLLMEELNRC
eukprot:GCRY01007695.1.p2 GENE.GCRY01007695.1~~GCRY01007695.1.p2  ORF type:complete len:113 (+),score=2.59 GCRY01007695.1:338-676(+)